MGFDSEVIFISKIVCATFLRKMVVNNFLSLFLKIINYL